MNRGAGRLIDNVHWNRGRLVGHLYLGSTLKLWEQSQQHRKRSTTRWIAASCDRVLKRSQNQGSLESRKLARPVRGWGRGEIPRPTPRELENWLGRIGLFTDAPKQNFVVRSVDATDRTNENCFVTSVSDKRA